MSLSFTSKILYSSRTLFHSTPRTHLPLLQRVLPSPTRSRRRASTATASAKLPRKQNRLPASYYRGGTSRAVIFAQHHLPADRGLWAEIFRGVIGSPDPNGRQLDGLGGGVSSLSKVCVVGRSTIDNADVDYTFAAVGVKDNEVDFSSNCGNMTAAIGPFAIDCGLVGVDEAVHGEGHERGEDWVGWESGEQERMTTVRIHNTNTGKIIHSTFRVVDEEAASEGDFAIDGVAGTGARIEMAFVNPGGSKTGKLLPTGNITDTFDGVEATCIDVGNPCVFILAEDLNVKGTILPDEMDAHPTVLVRLDSIRKQAAVAMGISSSLSTVPGSIPKIAMIAPATSHSLLSGEILNGKSVDILVRALSVGQPHRAIPITVAMAVAAAAELPGSTVHGLVPKKLVDRKGITLGHSSGQIVVGSTWSGGELTETKVFRTARRLMEGWVSWK